MPADLIAPVLSDFTAEFAAYPGDGDAWGTFDFYPEFAALLRRAVASGTHFDTGWVGVKKAPMNFRIRSAGRRRRRRWRRARPPRGARCR